MSDNDILPFLAFFAGLSVGLFYGVTFTLWRTKQRRLHNRKYANRGCHMVGTPPTADDELERRGDEWAQHIMARTHNSV